MIKIRNVENLTLGKPDTGALNGNVSIGIEAAATTDYELAISRINEEPKYQLLINNESTVTDANYGGILFTQGATADTTLASIKVDYTAAGKANLVLGTQSTSNALTILDDGKVGIGTGTNEPSAPLQIYRANPGGGARLLDVSTDEGHIFSVVNGHDDRDDCYLRSEGVMYLGTNADIDAVQINAGNVGIGTGANTPDSKLEVYAGDITISKNISPTLIFKELVTANDVTTAHNRWAIGNDDNNGFAISEGDDVVTAVNTRLTIKQTTGNVGIGRSPDTLLDLAQGGVLTLRGDQNAIHFRDGSDNLDFLVGQRSDIVANDFVFHSYGGNWVFSEGDVGVGSTDPNGYKLKISNHDEFSTTVAALAAKNLLLRLDSTITDAEAGTDQTQQWDFKVDWDKHLHIDSASSTGGIIFNAGSWGYEFNDGGVRVRDSLWLGEADVASAHINAYELMTFNIDVDNDDSDTRYFGWYKNSASGTGTELMKLDAGGILTANTIGLTANGVKIDGLGYYCDGGTGATQALCEASPNVGVWTKESWTITGGTNTLGIKDWHGTSLFNIDGVTNGSTFNGGLDVNSDTVKLYNSANTNNTYFFVENSGVGNAGVKMKNSQGEWTVIANDRLRFISDDDTPDLEVMSLHPGGGVGIGTGTLALLALLDVRKEAAGDLLYLGGSSDTPTYGQRGLKFSSSDVTVGTGNSALTYPGAVHTIDATSGAGIIDLATSGTARVRVAADGNVGIGTGTSEPANKLQIVGGTSITDGGAASPAASDGLHLMFDTATKVSWIKSEKLNTSNRGLQFLASQYVFNTGNVGIGTGSGAISSKLHVGTRASNTSDISIGDDDDNRAILTYIAGTTDAFTIGTRQSVTVNSTTTTTNYFDTLTIKDGKVGIGRNPASHLTVATDGTNDTPAEIGLWSTDTSIVNNDTIARIAAQGSDSGSSVPYQGAKIEFNADAAWDTGTNYYWPTRIDFFTQDASGVDRSTTPRLTIDKDGKVGVGTGSSVDTILHVEAADPVLKVEATGTNSPSVLNLHAAGTGSSKIQRSGTDQITITNGNIVKINNADLQLGDGTILPEIGESNRFHHLPIVEDDTGMVRRAHTAVQVVISAGGGPATTRATASAIISNGKIYEVKIVKGGAGYSAVSGEEPTVEFKGGRDTDANGGITATATISNSQIVGGKVTEMTITNSGNRYFGVGIVKPEETLEIADIIETRQAKWDQTTVIRIDVDTDSGTAGLQGLPYGVGYTDAPDIQIGNPWASGVSYSVTSPKTQVYGSNNVLYEITAGSGTASTQPTHRKGDVTGDVVAHNGISYKAVGERARANATVSGGAVERLVIVDAGSGYNAAPDVTVVAGSYGCTTCLASSHLTAVLGASKISGFNMIPESLVDANDEITIGSGSKVPQLRISTKGLIVGFAEKDNLGGGTAGSGGGGAIDEIVLTLHDNLYVNAQKNNQSLTLTDPNSTLDLFSDTSIFASKIVDSARAKAVIDSSPTGGANGYKAHDAQAVVHAGTNEKIERIDVLNVGQGYQSAPNVVISEPTKRPLVWSSTKTYNEGQWVFRPTASTTDPADYGYAYYCKLGPIQGGGNPESNTTNWQVRYELGSTTVPDLIKIGAGEQAEATATLGTGANADKVASITIDANKEGDGYYPDDQIALLGDTKEILDMTGTPIANMASALRSDIYPGTHYRAEDIISKADNNQTPGFTLTNNTLSLKVADDSDSVDLTTIARTIKATNGSTVNTLDAGETLDITAGSDISITEVGGVLTITNDAPDVNHNSWRPVTAGGNTLATTETLAFATGTGISIAESDGTVTITNSAPDVNHNVSTNLSIERGGTCSIPEHLTRTACEGATGGVWTPNFKVVSSDGNDASLPLADTDKWGLMSDIMFDKLGGIAAGATNTADNVSTNLSVSRGGTCSKSQHTTKATCETNSGVWTPDFKVVSSDGDDASLPLADANRWGLMSDKMFDDLYDHNHDTRYYTETEVDTLLAAIGVTTAANATAITTNATAITTNATAIGTKHPTIDANNRLSATLVGANGNVSNAEYGYLSGVTSDIQTQIGANATAASNNATAITGKQAALTSTSDISINKVHAAFTYDPSLLADPFSPGPFDQSHASMLAYAIAPYGTLATPSRPNNSGNWSTWKTVAGSSLGLPNYIAWDSAFIVNLSTITPATQISDERAKLNIRPLHFGLDFINKINPVTYHRDDAKTPRNSYGVLAQEIVELLEQEGEGLDHEAIVYNRQYKTNPDAPLAVAYSDFVPILIKSVQELTAKIETLENRIEELEK